MLLDYPRIMPYAIALLAVLLVYRRLRRSFGRQRLRPVRMRIRIGVLMVLAVALLPAAIRSGLFLAADLAGFAAGIALGIWGGRLTRYERREIGLYYIPHTFSGIAVSLLLVGRLVYRLIVAYSADRALGDVADPLQAIGSRAMFNSPLTVGLLFVVIGYYVCYYSWVLWRSNRIGPEDLEVAATPTAVSTNEYGGSSPGR
jgi:hypothetical protein